MDQIIRALIERLTGKGLEITSIPAYLSDLANTIAADGYLGLQELNNRLQMQGWNDLEIDDHTLQLFLMNFRKDDLEGMGSEKSH